MKFFEFCLSLTVLCVALTTTSGWLVGGGGGGRIPSFKCDDIASYFSTALLRLVVLPRPLPRIPGGKITINCKNGTQTSSGQRSFQIQCIFSKGWKGKQECIPVKCSSLSNPTNGRIQFTAATNYNSRARYTCNTGYRLPGSKAYLDRTCGYSGWSGSNYSCTVVDCESLTAPDHGAAEFNATTYGELAKYSCDEGYTLIGEPESTCEHNGEWSGTAPICQHPCGCNCQSSTNDSCLNSMAFSGQTGSYIKFDYDDWRPFLQTAIRYSFSISFEFKTTEDQGVIFYSSSSSSSRSGDYISVHMDSGSIYCHNVDSNPLVYLKSTGLYNDGRWHQAMCSKQKDELLLVVDEEILEASTSDSSRSTRTNGEYFLGGIQSSSSPPKVNSNLGFSTGFNGCLRNFRINDLCVGDDRDDNNVKFCEKC